MEDPILIAEYDAEWPMLYEQEKIKILNALDNTPHSALSTGTVDNFRQVEVCKVE
jgi:hypothetical protein